MVVLGCSWLTRPTAIFRPEHLNLAEDLVRPVAPEMIRVQYLVEN